MAINWKQKVAYDNRVRTFGGASATFVRDQISNGSAVNVRRYADLALPTSGVVNWSDSTAMTAGSALIKSGPDRDLTPLILCITSGNTGIEIYSWDGTGFTLESSTLLTALPEADATTTYTWGGNARGGDIFYGFIAITVERFISGVSKGITLIYSQDRGATWSLVESVAGGNQFPLIAGDVSSGMTTRGAIWAGPKAFPTGGLGAVGGHTKLDAVVLGCDYLGSTATPKGGQTYRYDITRADDGDDTIFAVGKARLVYEEWTTSQASGQTHFHCAGAIFDGTTVKVVTVIGDATHHNHITLSVFGSGSYETATITNTVDWSGDWNETDGSERASPQPVAATPFPSNSVGFSNDLKPEFIQVLESPADETSTPTWSSRFLLLDDNTAGVFYTTWAPLSLSWYPGVGWISGRQTLDNGGGRFFSRDSHNWTHLINDEVPDITDAMFLGEKLLTQKASSDTLLIADIPMLKGRKPLLLNPGIENLIETVTERNAPLDINTSKFVYYDGSYKYTADDSAVPNAPSIAPPRDNSQLIELSYLSTTTDSGPVFWLQDVSSGTIDATIEMHLDAWMFNLSGELTAPCYYQYGNAPAGADQTTILGYDYVSNQQWFPIGRHNAAQNTPPVNPARARMGRIFGGKSSTQPAGTTILIAICGIYSSAGPRPYPIASGISSPGNETEAVSGLTASTTGWTLAVALGRQYDSLPVDQPLFTAYIDATNYIEVEWLEASEEIRVTTTVGGSAGTPIDVGVGKWLRQFPLHIILSDDDTDLFVSVGSVEGLITHQTGSTETLTTSPTSIRFSNQDQTEVGNIDLYGMGYSPASSSEAERVAALHDQLYLLQPADEGLHAIETGIDV